MITQINGADRFISNQELAENIELKGLWDFYGKTLDLNDLDRRVPVEVEFPQMWTGQIIGNDTLNPIGYATYRLVLRFEKDHPGLSLMIDDMYTSYKLYANKEVLASNGRVATTQEDYEPHWEPVVVSLPADTNQVELILQVANFLHSKGGVKEPILIGTTSSIAYYDLQKKAYALMITGSLILGGLFFIGLYWFGRNDLSMFYFSMFCLFYTYRIIGTDYYVLHQLIPNMSWSLSLHMEYISLFMSVFFFAHFLYSLFPDENNKWVVRIISGICLLMTVITLATPPLWFTKLMYYFILLMVAMIGYAFSAFFRAYRNKRPGSQYGVISVAIVLIVMVATAAEYFRWFVAPDAFFFFGYIAFFFSQSLILSYRFSARLKESVMIAEQANQAKVEFLSTISHELRTPLNAISGLTRLLYDNQPRPDQVNFLRSIKLSANNLLALVTDILDFSKIEQGKVDLDHSAFYLEDVFNQVINNYSPVAAENGLEFHYDVDVHFRGLKVKSDQTRINQVLNNLISNALKFTKHGYVGLKAEWLEETISEVRFIVEVEDTGVGIPQDKLENIFYEFSQVSSSSTREFGGVGLGLTIVRNILQAMGSKITVASTLNEGSRFTFELKLPKDTIQATKPPVAPKPKPSEKGEIDYKNTSILIAEDDMMNAMICEQYLKSIGIKPTVCINGKEAVELASKQSFDLILMDMHMPVMDGYQATKAILYQNPHQRIIALTGSVTTSAYKGLKQLGFHAVLSKPFRKQDFIDAVNESLLQ